jgi:hypothetical protein
LSFSKIFSFRLFIIFISFIVQDLLRLPIYHRIYSCYQNSHWMLLYRLILFFRPSVFTPAKRRDVLIPPLLFYHFWGHPLPGFTDPFMKFISR